MTNGSRPKALVASSWGLNGPWPTASSPIKATRRAIGTVCLRISSCWRGSLGSKIVNPVMSSFGLLCVRNEFGRGNYHEEHAGNRSTGRLQRPGRHRRQVRRSHSPGAFEVCNRLRQPFRLVRRLPPLLLRQPSCSLPCIRGSERVERNALTTGSLDTSDPREPRPKKSYAGQWQRTPRQRLPSMTQSKERARLPTQRESMISCACERLHEPLDRDDRKSGHDGAAQLMAP